LGFFEEDADADGGLGEAIVVMLGLVGWGLRIVVLVGSLEYCSWLLGTLYTSVQRTGCVVTTRSAVRSYITWTLLILPIAFRLCSFLRTNGDRNNVAA
jgi:hypothetical protein